MMCSVKKPWEIVGGKIVEYDRDEVTSFFVVEKNGKRYRVYPFCFDSIVVLVMVVCFMCMSASKFY